VGDRRARPTREMGYDAAARAVASPVAEGSVGAGAGASVGKIHGIARAMRGGIGSASVRLGEVVVGALVAVNAAGDVRDPDAGARAICRAVRAAASLPHLPAARDL